jgi:hypothetical protein
MDSKDGIGPVFIENLKKASFYSKKIKTSSIEKYFTLKYLVSAANSNIPLPDF